MSKLSQKSKTCFKCSITKPLSEYQKNKARKDGVETYCRECNNARIKANYEKNPEYKIAKTREYHVNNPEWSKEVQHEWHQRNKGRRLAKIKERLATDPEFRAYRRDLVARKERERRAQKALTEVIKVTKEDYQNILNEYSGTCWVCSTILDKVVWDHVQPLSKGGAHSTSNLRPICNPCNVRKNSLWPFTDKMKEKIAAEVRALRTHQANTMLVTGGLEVI